MFLNQKARREKRSAPSSRVSCHPISLSLASSISLPAATITTHNPLFFPSSSSSRFSLLSLTHDRFPVTQLSAGGSLWALMPETGSRIRDRLVGMAEGIRSSSSGRQHIHRHTYTQDLAVLMCQETGGWIGCNQRWERERNTVWRRDRRSLDWANWVVVWTGRKEKAIVWALGS